MSILLRRVSFPCHRLRYFSGTAIHCLKDGETASLIRKITSEDLKVFGDLVEDHNPVVPRFRRFSDLNTYLGALHIL